MPTPDELRNFTPEQWDRHEAKCWLSAVVDCGLPLESLDRHEQMLVRAELSVNAEAFAKISIGKKRDGP